MSDENEQATAEAADNHTDGPEQPATEEAPPAPAQEPSGWSHPYLPEPPENLIEACRSVFLDGVDILRGGWTEKAGRDEVRWVGPEIAKSEHEQSSGGTAAERVARAAGWGKSTVEFTATVIEIAVMLGVEQGRRLEREEMRTSVALLDATYAHYGTVIRAICDGHNVPSHVRYSFEKSE